MLLATVWTALWAALLPSPAGAQSGGERITSFDSDIVVATDGTTTVTEKIAYDFGAESRHGIERYVPTRVPYDETKKDYDRLYPLEVLDVSSTAPAEYETSTENGNTRLRIGDPDQLVTGTHTYEIRYQIRGGLNHFPDHDELYYNVTGNGWDVPIDKVTATVTVPGSSITQAACLAGPQGSRLSCTSHQIDGNQVDFTNGPLGPYEGVTVVVGIPTGVISPTPEPILEQRWTLARAFAVRPDTVGPSAGLLAVGALGVGAVMYKVGRDRRFQGSPTDVAFGGDHLPDERAPLRRGPIPVEFVPPDNLRPGQVGTLIDEQANPLDVTATIIDLAVRGYLRLEEIPKEGWMGQADWRLVRLRDGGGLLPFEHRLFDGMFAKGDRVALSSLKNTFAAKLKAVQDDLYDDTIEQGWFTRRPDQSRSAWRAVGVVAVIAAVGVTVLLAWKTSYALLGLPLALAAVVLLIGSKWMPRRTAKGYGVLQRTLGFKRFIDESEKDRAQFAERQNLFTEYLPYAIVFGATERWARAFAGLDGQLPDQSGWYVGPNVFDVLLFSHLMNGFAVTAAGTMTSVPAPTGGGGTSGFSGFGGGGFSGGGFGGGGGGSW